MDDEPTTAEPGEAPPPIQPPAALTEQPAGVTEGRPVWTYFLTPAAVVIAGCIIAGAVWFTRGDDNDKAAPSGQRVAAESTMPAAASTSGATQPQSLLTVFTGYAKQLGLDEGKFSACLSDSNSVTVINKQLQRGSGLGINGTPTFVINNKLLVGAQPAQIFDEIVQAELKGSPTSIDSYSPAVQALANQQPPQFRILDAKPDVSDAQIEGNPQAKVMIAEFSDFQCPFCKQWTDQNMKRVRGEIGDQVAFAFLHFPITQIHPNAGNASLVAVCAGQQGKFWQMHDLLFARQAEWAKLQ